MLPTVDPFKAEEDFRQALRDAGLVPPDGIIADGNLHRINADDEKPGKKSGFYVYHSDGLPAGAFGDWHEGPDGWHTWHAKIDRELSQEESREFKRRLDAARAARTSEQEKRKGEAREVAAKLWADANPCDDHPYLKRKGVKSHGLRLGSDGRLMIPILDIDGNIHSLERIDADGGKLFLAGGRKAGCMFGIGNPDRIICLAEGYATAASIHEATGYYVVVAFDCGNLTPVAKQLRDKYPTAKLLICADHDPKPDGKNPGADAAAKAAKAANAMVATPDMPSGGDFNDQHALKGPESVAETIQTALDADDGPVDACDLFPYVLRELQARKEGKSRQSLDFGIGSVDRLTGGLRRGMMTVIAGLPGSGKTAAAIGVINHNATQGIPCLLFSIEMDKFDIGARFISQRARVPTFDLISRHRTLTKANWTSMYTAAESLQKIALTVVDRPVTLSQIEDETCRWYARKVRAGGHETALVAIDYLGLIRGEDSGETRNREVAMLAQGIKLLVRKLGLCGLLLAQLNRLAARREGEPEISDLRDSGEVEAAADLILFPYPWPRVRNSEGLWVMKEPKEAGKKQVDLWLCKKNKNGPIGAAGVLWKQEIMQYCPVAQDEVEDERREPESTEDRPHWSDQGR